MMLTVYVSQITLARLQKAEADNDLTVAQMAEAPIGAFAGTDPMSMHRIGKRAAGRMLDGRTHDEMPPHARNP
jgi:hypothetical protein